MNNWKDNIETRLYNECYNGILVCGLNWGGTAKENDTFFTENEKQFISHPIYNNYKFVNRIVKWFSLFGHELSSVNPGKFEKSFVYTNWLTSQSPQFDKSNPYSKLLQDTNHIVSIIHQLKPSIIFFFSKNMIFAINEVDIYDRVKSILGPKKELIELSSSQAIKRTSFKKFKIYKQEYENCIIISLPHPTGSKGLSNDYIDLFRVDIGNVLNQFKDINKI